MIDGIDLLIMVIALIVLFLVWHFGAKYSEWIVWDHERRHQRMLSRIRYYEIQEEEEYRQRLRLFIPVWVMVTAMMKLREATDLAALAFKEFNLKLLQGGKSVGVQSGGDYPDPEHPETA